MTFGVVGLGRIGGGLALQAMTKGHSAVGFDPGEGLPELAESGLERAESLADLAARLPAPRLVMLYVPAGRAVDQAIEELAPHLAEGDLIVDGGNSYWKDSQARAEELSEKGIGFIDLGTSGGLNGAKTGACFMAGGLPEHFARLEPLLRDLAVKGGVAHCGPSGAGHFVKLVHNGVEFGMLQAIGEGIDLLEKFPDAELDLAEITRMWRHGSVVRSWLVDLMHESLAAGPGMEGAPGYIEDTGEVNWLVQDALELETPIPVISASVMQLFASRDERRAWARAVALMRRGFGGHPLGPDPAVARARSTSRRGPNQAE
jgi:6-phosphogluconate dehydrogenase